MSGIDIAILSTHTENGQIANRPMSNNGDVAYDGSSHSFTSDGTRLVSDTAANFNVVSASSQASHAAGCTSRLKAGPN
jgi:general stress protein 26